MKAATPRDKFIALMTAVHRKLGRYKSGTTVGWNDNLTTNGHFVTVTQSSLYERGKADEQFVFGIAGGATALAGYHVNADALILG